MCWGKSVQDLHRGVHHQGIETGLPRLLVLYCARHTFGTAVYEATGNLAMVRKVMGHTDVRTSMRYQHPVLDSIREAIDLRNSRHSDLRVR
jgi:integrase